MSIDEVFKEARDVRKAFGELRREIKAAKPGGINAEETAAIFSDFADLAVEISELIGSTVSNKDEFRSAFIALLQQGTA